MVCRLTFEDRGVLMRNMEGLSWPVIYLISSASRAGPISDRVVNPVALKYKNNV